MASNKNWKRYILIAIFMAIFCIFVAAWFLNLQFNSPRINYSITLLTLTIPLICLILFPVNFKSGNKTEKVLKILLFFLTIVSSLVFLGVLFLSSYELPGIILKDVDVSLKRTVIIDNEIYRVTLGDAGAFGSTNVIVTKETEILPGLYSVKFIGNEYHAWDAKITKNPDGSIKIQYIFFPGDENL